MLKSSSTQPPCSFFFVWISSVPPQPAQLSILDQSCMPNMTKPTCAKQVILSSGEVRKEQEGHVGAYWGREKHQVHKYSSRFHEFWSVCRRADIKKNVFLFMLSCWSPWPRFASFIANCEKEHSLNHLKMLLTVSSFDFMKLEKYIYLELDAVLLLILACGRVYHSSACLYSKNSK